MVLGILETKMPAGINVLTLSDVSNFVNNFKSTNVEQLLLYLCNYRNGDIILFFRTICHLKKSDILSLITSVTTRLNVSWDNLKKYKHINCNCRDYERLLIKILQENETYTNYRVGTYQYFRYHFISTDSEEDNHIYRNNLADIISDPNDCNDHVSLTQSNDQLRVKLKSNTRIDVESQITQFYKHWCDKDILNVTEKEKIDNLNNKIFTNKRESIPILHFLEPHNFYHTQTEYINTLLEKSSIADFFCLYFLKITTSYKDIERLLPDYLRSSLNDKNSFESMYLYITNFLSGRTLLLTDTSSFASYKLPHVVNIDDVKGSNVIGGRLETSTLDDFMIQKNYNGFKVIISCKENKKVYICSCNGIKVQKISIDVHDDFFSHVINPLTNFTAEVIIMGSLSCGNESGNDKLDSQSIVSPTSLQVMNNVSGGTVYVITDIYIWNSENLLQYSYESRQDFVKRFCSNVLNKNVIPAEYIVGRENIIDAAIRFKTEYIQLLKTRLPYFNGVVFRKRHFNWTKILLKKKFNDKRIDFFNLLGGFSVITNETSDICVNPVIMPSTMEISIFGYFKHKLNLLTVFRSFPRNYKSKIDSNQPSALLKQIEKREKYVLRIVNYNTIENKFYIFQQIDNINLNENRSVQGEMTSMNKIIINRKAYIWFIFEYKFNFIDIVRDSPPKIFIKDILNIRFRPDLSLIDAHIFF